MFIGAMIMAPLAAYTMKWLDSLWEGKIKAGFEMLVNMFSAGIWGFVMAIVGLLPRSPGWSTDSCAVLSNAVDWLVDDEPAAADEHHHRAGEGAVPQQRDQPRRADAARHPAGRPKTGSSILFLLEANPGPGVGLLLAFTFFGIGAARASAPGAAVIQFFGGIHEVYFPYALMKPMLILALIAGGVTGVTTNMLLGGALRAPGGAGQHHRGAGADGDRRVLRRHPVGDPGRGRHVPHHRRSSSGPRASATSRRWP